VNKFSLSGKVAIVTGGGRGIGRAIADALAEAGADVAVAARKQAPLEEAVKAAQAKGRRAKAYSVDLRSVSALRALVDDVVKDFGDLHILINNAGVQLLAPAEELSEEYWDETLTTNLKAPFFLAQAAAKHFIKRGGGGKIVNITSIWAEVGFPLFRQGRASAHDTGANIRVGPVWDQRQRGWTDAQHHRHDAGARRRRGIQQRLHAQASARAVRQPSGGRRRRRVSLELGLRLRVWAAIDG
jgi:NAD(P)-dependent dehydrogenase (short-subunit alcohol dehydrogenase family)